MEESVASTVADGEIIGIQFGLASHHEIRISSISDCPISHASQLANPFLGLPLETGKCESCGTAEPGKCEGHFGYIELPIPIYHPSHISELRRMLSLLCLKCLKLKTSKFPLKNNGVMERLLSACCEETCHISIRENKNNDGAVFLELRIPSRSRVQEGAWNFLEKYGYRYGHGSCRTLLPSEVLVILKKLPEETRRKLARKGFFPQDGYILHYLPVPPNCLSVPDISDGISVMSSDLSATMLKKVLRQIEIIRSSRSGEPNFESHEVEANELQVAVSNYLLVRGTGKAAHDGDNRYGVRKEANNSSTKAWLEKMRTLFISKGSGFSSRSVITGDAYKPVNEIGVPSEIAQKMTFEERVNVHNIQFLQSLVDQNLCLTFRDGLSTYSLREGSKGHTFLRPGQVVHRRIMDGDIVFINRPPTTHKHSLQALRVYIHEDHTVKINPLMCGPLAADFDGDCVHLFYPQSLSARAEVLELFSVEKQLLSSHSGNLNLQLATDALLSLKTMFKVLFLDKASAQQLAMYAATPLPSPALLKARSAGPRWTALQVLQTALPSQFECHGDRLLIRSSEVVKLDFNRDVMASIINEIVTSLFFNKKPMEALNFFDSLQPLLMENLFAEGFSVGLHDFYIPVSELQSIQSEIQKISPLLYQLRSSFNELIQLQFESHMRLLKLPVAKFFLKSSALGDLIDSRSDSSIDKVVQQIGFLGLQLSDKRKFYSRSLVEEVASLFHHKYPFGDAYPSEEFGVVKSCFFRGLDPYEEMVHSIATREVIVRSSKGLAEPGTLFKNLMAILRDVVICYDGSVRNISSNSIIQFEYGLGGVPSQNLFPAGEPVGVLAATAMSNPAYKAVLDSSPSSNSSWDMMKEILFCRVNFKNDLNDRRVILYLNPCGCGRMYCQENASIVVKNHLRKVSLRDAAVEFSIEYKQRKAEPGTADIDTGLVGHIHLNKALLNEANIGMHDILQKCEDAVNLLRKRKKYGYHFKRISLSESECCFFQHRGSKWTDMPCLKFFWPDMTDGHLEKISHIMADMICPVLLDTIIKGDPRISSVNIIWTSPDTTTWVQSPLSSRKGELAVEVTLEKSAVRQSGDGWRIVLDCCLPVFHLIDAKRSIPYAIKQIQELLGISCTFDQAVQRLATSVTLVAKGVMKEHLLLLASSMTCAGNLVGFNMSGIKALCRALSVQVPFTEATLYTPRKCFERASEKCHVDSLASIVASCSWGKRVAVGTGAKFDILWDTKEIEMDDKPIDVYNFLQLVRGSNEEEIGTDCLGEEVEKFDMEDAYMEPALSPDQEIKAVFEENIEVGSDSQVPGGGDSSWDAFPSSNTASASGQGWNAGSGSAESSGWSNWGQKKDLSQAEDLSKAGGWGAQKSVNGSNQTETSSAWGKAVKESDNVEKSNGWQAKVAKVMNTSASDAWAQPEAEPPNAWNKEVQEKNAGSNEKAVHAQLGWGSDNEKGSQTAWNSGHKEKPSQSASSTAWDSSGNESFKKSQWGQQTDWRRKQDGPDRIPSGSSWKTNNDESAGRWNSSKGSEQAGAGSSAWGQQSDSKKKNSYETGSGGWVSHKEENKTNSSWGKPDSSTCKNNSGCASGWASEKTGEETCSGGWQSQSGKNKAQSSWGKPESSTLKNVSEAASSWGSEKACKEADSGGWGSQNEKNKAQSSWGQPGSSTWKSNNGGAGNWNSEKACKEAGNKSWEPKEEESRHGKREWRSDKSNQPSNSAKIGDKSDWSSHKAVGGVGSDSQPSWGQAGSSGWNNKRAEGGQSRGPSNSGEWKKADQSPAGSQGWDSQKADAGCENDLQSPWGQGGSSGWKKHPEGGRGWGSSNSREWKKPDAGIDSDSQSPAGSHGWGSKKVDAAIENDSQSAWGQGGSSGWNKKGSEGGGWGSSNSREWKKPDAGIDSNSQSPAGSHGWSSKKFDTAVENDSQSAWGQGGSSGWNKKCSEGGGWGSSNSGGWKKADVAIENDSQSPAGSEGWDSPKAVGGTEIDSQSSPWRQGASSGWKKMRPEGGRGWGSSNSGEWKNKKNRPPKQPGVSNDDSAPVAFTATRKRMDIFTPEEQDALSEMETIMSSVRRIMHQTGCNDGEPLPADDQSYIINNVLEHHPDKAAKKGAGVDYITVKKHSSFQESRCFYVVSSDGQTQDFSYIKCLENLIKGKYPSIADSFCSKYFRRPRAAGNRLQESS